MKINKFMGVSALILSLITHSVLAQSTQSVKAQSEQHVQFQLIRNATVKITYADTTFLIDPMFAKKGFYPGFENTFRHELRNPLVELPISVSDIIDDVDAVIVTHTHLDHWDAAAQAALQKDIPLFTQNEADAKLIQSQGFTNVQVLGDHTEFQGIVLHKTNGQHGTDAMYSLPELASFLGEAMGIVFQAKDYKTVYLVGDTIWRPEVEQSIVKYSPDVIILNAGNALIDGFDESIIMGEDDALRTHQVAPNAKIVAVHMDAVNHMALSRRALADFAEEKDIQDVILIPADGEGYKF